MASAPPTRMRNAESGQHHQEEGPGAKMADVEACATRHLKNTSILVTVEEALDDLLVVSFASGPRCFQGVLLDATKRSWPLGIVAPTPFPGSIPATDGSSDQQSLAEDKLFAVSRRFTYFQQDTQSSADKPDGGGGPANGSRNGACSLLPHRRNYCKRLTERGAGRTMRLRPRQVLCSKCKSICSESAENVEASRRSEPATTTNDTGSAASIDRVTNGAPLASRTPLCGSGSNNGKTGHETNVDQATGDRLSGGSAGRERMVLRRRRAADDMPATTALPPVTPPAASKRSRDGDFDALLASPTSPEVISLPSCEIRSVDQQQLGMATAAAKTSPFIKISFGPQGTVLKIPPRSHSYSAELLEQEQEEMLTPLIDSATLAIRDAGAKAARKALKRAKREAQRTAGASPTPGTPPPSDTVDRSQRHHRHKFKHKRRHSRGGEAGPGESHHHPVPPPPPSATTATTNAPTGTWPTLLGEHNGVSPGRLQPPQHLHDDAESSENASPDSNAWDVGRPDGTGRPPGTYSEIKKECLRQKLSISLKRLSEKSYVKCGSPSAAETTGLSLPDDGDSDGGAPGLDAGVGVGSETDEGETGDGVPGLDGGGGGGGAAGVVLVGAGVGAGVGDDAGAERAARPLTMRISSHRVAATRLSEGGATLTVGDVVWGKIHGFPWWPGRVLSITVSRRDNGLLVTQQAHVAWFGSSTSSSVPCAQLVPFLECFNTRYNKKKRGPYKEAIKQATLAAQQALGAARAVVDIEM